MLECEAMKILVVEPGKKPRETFIDGSLESMQEVVGGLIEICKPFDDDVAVVMNEEGKLLDLSLNRALYDREGNLQDIICGTFFIAAAPPDCDTLKSLFPEEMSKYKRQFQYPEKFYSDGLSIRVIRKTDERKMEGVR